MSTPPSPNIHTETTEDMRHLNASHDQEFSNPWDIHDTPTQNVTTITHPQESTSGPKPPKLFKLWVLLTITSLPIAVLLGVGGWLALRQPITTTSPQDTVGHRGTHDL